MKIGAIVRARMSSKRFPGKVLHKVLGKSLLHYLLERLEHTSCANSIVIATSKNHDDDLIEAFAREHNIQFYRGDLNNVASRFIETLDKYGFENFVRVNADSPLLDPALIERAINKLKNSSVEIVTNTMKRTYPKGQSVEVFKSETFRRGYQRMKCDEDYEHVTQFFYRNSSDFKIFNFTADENYSHIHLCVDTQKDMEMFNAIISKMSRPHWEYGITDILRIYKTVLKTNNYDG